MNHSTLTLNHKIENWTYANAAARTGAGGFVSADVGKVAYQTDTGVYYRLTATTPTWAAIGSGGGSGTVTHTGAALAAHKVVVGNGTDDVEVIAATGTAGQYLRSGGSGADPAMATPTPTEVGLGNVTNDAQLKAADLDTDGTLAANSDSKIPSQKAVKTYVTAHGGGALVLLESHTASSSASLDFTSRNATGQSGATIQSDYEQYLIVADGIVPASSAVDFKLQVGTGGTPTYDTGNNYEWSSLAYSTGGTAPNQFGSTGAGMKILATMGNTAGWAGNFSLTAMSLNSTSLRKVFTGTSFFVNSSPAACNSLFGGTWVTTGTAVTALKFLMSSGNIASGTIRIYGIAK